MSSTKCFSSCRQTPKTKCNLPRCTYTNGKTYKYCRLSQKYIMIKSKDGHCVTKKRQPKEIEAKKRIGKFMLMAINKRKLEARQKIIEKIKRATYGRRIRTFMRKTTQKRRAEFLKAVCSDAGVCITFGQEENKIRMFFNGFTKFDFVHGLIKRMGKPSNNGFVHSVEYMKNGYVAHSIIKSSAKMDGDNLFYEFMVGRFLNNICKIVPCFLETYGLYGYNNIANWKHAKNTQEISPDVFSASLTRLNPNKNSTIQDSCADSRLIAILIQYIHNAETLEDKMNNLTHDLRINGSVNSTLFANIHLPSILFQVYRPLAQIMSTFTHYDLHRGNILLYIPVTNKYIHYHYHNPNGIMTEFKSEYIVKIIDYGRSFFVDKMSNIPTSSSSLYKAFCKEPICNISEPCGGDRGFSWLRPEDRPGSNYYIFSQVNNISHDLRLLYEISNFSEHVIDKNKKLYTIINKVKYDARFGTKEIKRSGLPNNIFTINDAYKELTAHLMDPEVKIENDTFYADPKYSKLGDLYIHYDGRSMRFVKT